MYAPSAKNVHATSVLLRRFSSIRRLMPGLRRVTVVFWTTGKDDADYVGAVLAFGELIRVELTFSVIENPAALAALADAGVAELDRVFLLGSWTPATIDVLRRFRRIGQLSLGGQASPRSADLELVRLLSGTVGELVDLLRGWRPEAVAGAGAGAGAEAAAEAEAIAAVLAGADLSGFPSVVVEVKSDHHAFKGIPPQAKHATRVDLLKECFDHEGREGREGHEGREGREGREGWLMAVLGASPRLREVHLHNPPLDRLLTGGFVWKLLTGPLARPDTQVVLHVDSLCSTAIVPFARAVTGPHLRLVVVGKASVAKEELACADLLAKLFQDQRDRVAITTTDLGPCCSKSGRPIFEPTTEAFFKSPRDDAVQLLDRLADARPDLAAAWSAFFFS
jgi:hypothetical protein